VGGGYFHPLLKVRTEFRRIFLEMGFEEMPTNKWVESSFWNFDSLFQPQSHPARGKTQKIACFLSLCNVPNSL
jgi:phenylalanyl-tRNA synthetase alpha chain